MMDGLTPGTGLRDLDEILCGLMPGDNVVWQVDAIEHYAPFVRPFAANASSHGIRVTYFRFARHAPLLEAADRVQVLRLNPQRGFEAFLDQIHHSIRENGEGGAYIFDSISDLLAEWCSDQMVGNFFMLTCPFLRAFKAVAYFAILRDFHSAYATDPITQTTQILLDVYQHEHKLYLHPQRVKGRRGSGRLHRLFVLEGNTVRALQESGAIARVMVGAPRSGLGLIQRYLGVWTRSFMQAETLLEEWRAGYVSEERVCETTRNLMRMAITRDERMFRLAARYVDLDDLVWLGTRMLGTGLIGGKSVEMLIARKVLLRADPRWRELLEPNDPFFVPSDIFYTYLVRNGCWAIRKRQLSAEDPLEGAEEAYQAILQGSFPAHIEKRFAEMLDYFGQSPLVVRSSSLLEDSFGNSFAGKYDSVYCVNQGSREERLEAFMTAVKTVYASTMSREALAYRARHNLLQSDEQMALLVQRVSGAQHGRYHFPHVAGVAYSYNPYVWHDRIDPHAGVIRLVCGLGTRAVDRQDDDHTRLIALNAPELQPENDSEARARPAQRRIDVVDLDKNRLCTVDFDHIVAEIPDAVRSLLVSYDVRVARAARERGIRAAHVQRLSFDGLLQKTDFALNMQRMLQTLETAYEYPVDIEFAVTFREDAGYQIALLQCRPLQAKGVSQPLEPLDNIPNDKAILRAKGPVVGRSRWCPIDRIVYVSLDEYGRLPEASRYAVARLIGRINALTPKAVIPPTVMLIGPGRWGSKMPSLGVPVTYAEINHVSVLCEVAAMRDDLKPDISFGTHFFGELVENDVLYFAFHLDSESIYINRAFFTESENRLAKLLPEAAALEHVLCVIEPDDAHLWADNIAQEVVLYRASRP